MEEKSDGNGENCRETGGKKKGRKKLNTQWEKYNAIRYKIVICVSEVTNVCDMRWVIMKNIAKIRNVRIVSYSLISNASRIFIYLCWVLAIMFITIFITFSIHFYGYFCRNKWRLSAPYIFLCSFGRYTWFWWVIQYFELENVILMHRGQEKCKSFGIDIKGNLFEEIHHNTLYRHLHLQDEENKRFFFLI